MDPAPWTTPRQALPLINTPTGHAPLSTPRQVTPPYPHPAPDQHPNRPRPLINTPTGHAPLSTPRPRSTPQQATPPDQHPDRSRPLIHTPPLINTPTGHAPLSTPPPPDQHPNRPRPLIHTPTGHAPWSTPRQAPPPPCSSRGGLCCCRPGPEENLFLSCCVHVSSGKSIALSGFWLESHAAVLPPDTLRVTPGDDATLRCPLLAGPAPAYNPAHTPGSGPAPVLVSWYRQRAGRGPGLILSFRLANVSAARYGVDFGPDKVRGGANGSLLLRGSQQSDAAVYYCGLSGEEPEKKKQQDARRAASTD
ncbi:proline-rich protein 36-like [Myripristis murdjan]|uniref:proline-rich protein 36-like n=1 Tax=Myripristis murdjan TaxID=586833 RepID=UPI001175C937|nr:proline-rich protein 36-like [Myripristis murdjan]